MWLFMHVDFRPASCTHSTQKAVVKRSPSRTSVVLKKVTREASARDVPTRRRRTANSYSASAGKSHPPSHSAPRPTTLEQTILLPSPSPHAPLPSEPTMADVNEYEEDELADYEEQEEEETVAAAKTDAT